MTHIASHDFSDLAARFASEKDVELPAPKKPGFGAATLRCNGKIFAMCPDGDALVVKLSAARAAELVELQRAQPYAIGGKTMKEWVSIPRGDRTAWAAWADEALAEARRVATRRSR